MEEVDVVDDELEDDEGMGPLLVVEVVLVVEVTT